MSDKSYKKSARSERDREDGSSEKSEEKKRDGTFLKFQRSTTDNARSKAVEREKRSRSSSREEHRHERERDRGRKDRTRSRSRSRSRDRRDYRRRNNRRDIRDKTREVQEKLEKNRSLWKRDGAAVDNNLECPGPSSQNCSEVGGDGKLRQKWEAVICASQPGTDVEKFQRLMGMKKAQAPAISSDDDIAEQKPKSAGLAAVSGKPNAVEMEKARQEKASVELQRQYEQARSTTLFGYRRGLGF